MGFLRWFTANVADTRAGTHADLGPLTLPGPVPVAAARVRTAVGTLPMWAAAGGPTDAELHFTRTTRVARYVDDVVVTLEPAGDAVTVHARSRSRVGKGDLGQNRRNVLELWRALTAKA